LEERLAANKVARERGGVRSDKVDPPSLNELANKFRGSGNKSDPKVRGLARSC
jgi:hypothetical protein